MSSMHSGIWNLWVIDVESLSFKSEWILFTTSIQVDCQVLRYEFLVIFKIENYLKLNLKIFEWHQMHSFRVL